MAIDDEMTAAHLLRAQTHVYNICQTGADVALIKPGTKDRLGTILTESSLTLKTFPVRFTPFSKEIHLKVSWAENVDVIFFVALREVFLLSLTINDLKHYTNAKYENKDYELAYVDLYSNFGTGFLYVIIGAKL